MAPVNVGRVVFVPAGALLAWALFFGRGDSPTRLAWIVGAALGLAALVTAAALDGRIVRPRIGRLGAACLACFTGLVVWQGISIIWSVQPDRSWDYVNRGLVYLALLTVGMFLGALLPHATRTFAAGLAALLTLVLAYALLAKGVPALYPDYGRLARLRSPLGAWNQLALVGDFALALGVWRAAQRRWDGVVIIFAATLTILLTYSRGGVVIALLVVAAWLALDRRWFESLLALAIGGGAGVAVAGIAFALHGVTDDKQSHAARVHDGRLFLASVLITAVVVVALGRVALRLEPAPPMRRRASVLLLAAIALACTAGIAAAAVHSGGVTHTSSAGSYCPQTGVRFGCASSDARLEWWTEAWQSFEDRPLLGSGAASFELAHRLHRADYTRPVTEPHNFALQMLGETGLVGFLLFAGAVGFAVVAIRRRLRDDPAAVALALCALAYLAHILVDVGYDFVGVSAPVFMLLGLLLVDGGERAARREPLWAFGALLLAATVVLSLAAPAVAQRKVDDAVATGNPELAAQAHDWNPVSVDPLLTQAEIEESLGHKLNALELYHQAVDTQPDNPVARVELGRFELEVLKDACTAYRELSTAYGLDRYNPVIAKDGGLLDVARAKARARGCG